MTTTVRGKWILPPQLKWHFDQFVDLYGRVFRKPENRRRPLLFHGDPGVGKSLFTHAFEVLYRKDSPRQLTADDVKRVNVAALAENIFESEIFGHVKGAFTGATAPKKGFLENTKLLILEEIGELSKPTQAKLLTFMEDGIYYRVGDTVPGKAAQDIQIIATTNVPLDAIHFRHDFLDRCYTFHVPALHERRSDILYILACQYPDLFKTLSPGEIMMVLCYNWPGNMREIEKFGETKNSSYGRKDFLSMASIGKQTDFYSDYARIETMLTLLASMEIYETRKQEEDIEGFFLQGSLSINSFRDYPLTARQNHKELTKEMKAIAFKKVKLDLKELDGFGDILLMDRHPELRRTYGYFMLFTLLLHIKHTADIDIYDVDELSNKPECVSWASEEDVDRIFENQLSQDPPKNAEVAKEWLEKTRQYREENGFPFQYYDSEEQFDPYAVSEEDLLKSYYRALLERYSGNVAAVARHCRIVRTTLDSKLKRLGIHSSIK